jgi:outer membrane protein assembly factor BamB
VTRRTTICCSALLLLALAKRPDPVGLVPLRPVWTLALNNHLSFAPAFDERRGYFAIEGDRLVAYEVVSGKQLWIVKAAMVLPPIAADDLVYCVETGAVVARRTADGSVAWRTEIAEPLAVRPTAGHGWVVGVTKSGTVLAIRAADGQVAWRRDLASPPRVPVTISAIAQQRVYVPTTGSRIVALEMTTGEPAWERRVGGLPGEVLALEGRVYAGSTDTFTYCLMAKDGQIDWRYRTGGDVLGVPVADDRRIYVVSKDNVLRALNQVSGGQHWMRALPFRPTAGPLLAGGVLAVAGEFPTIKTFNAKDGSPATDITAGDEVTAPPQLLQEPGTGLPMLVVVTRHIIKGDTVALSVRTLEPAGTPFAPLANTVTPPPMQAPRQ